MSWTPEEIDIIDYLYESISAEKKDKFENYLKENPEFAKEINDLRLTQKVLPSFPDEEVIPPVPMTESGSVNKRSISRNWLVPISVAASLTLLLVTGYLTEFRMSFNQDGFHIGFSEPVQETGIYLTEAEIDDMIAQKVNSYAQQVDGRFTSLQTGFETQLATNQKITSEQMKKLASQPSSAELDDAQVLQFIGQLQDENKKMMQSFYQVSADEQQNYMRNILLEYSDYLANQRQEDLQFIQANLLDIKNTSEVKQEETDKILANIITTVNNQNSPGNDRLSLD